MLTYKRVFRKKRHKEPKRHGDLYGNVKVTFVGWFLLGFIPLIVWQVTEEDAWKS